MEYRKIGSLKVSPIGMGCMGLSHGYGQIPERSYSIEAIRMAYDFGCSFFDTAEVYGNVLYYEGHNEEIVGEAIKEFREDIVLATKLLVDEKELVGRSLYDVIFEHLQASMNRLQTDHVDLYYLHRINEFIPVEDVAEVMGRLIEEGHIREYGLSQVGVPTLEKANKVSHVAAVQNIYNILERDCEEDIFPYSHDNDLAVVPFSPIASGFLSGKITADSDFSHHDDVRKFVPQLSKENIAANQPILDVIARFADEKDATNAQISLAWMLAKYPNVVPIPGSKNKERILENLGAWDVKLSRDEFEQLDEELNRCSIYGHRGHVESQQRTFGNRWAKKDE